ncbi:unnamed protein product [Macrosiphum euphorbiae]|uniref:THAP-type domain-containing protein n=1 Tax=Macrosiphum euphorbiae TaxID=13131 RepID=A0AAV0WLJ2_9HEMI|nr:unnamed protein product [Macrosiphum euphorbiae]
MPSCIICGRTKNQTSKAANISFHMFPKDESDKIKWNNFLIKNFLNPENVTISSLVCSLHFDKSCFILNKSRKLLKRQPLHP